MEIDCLQRNGTFKSQISLNRHNARQKLNYCLLPDPPLFSLPSVKVSIRIHYSNTDRLLGDWVYEDDQLVFSLHWVLLNYYFLPDLSHFSLPSTFNM
jgi:hypothetical protein